MNQYWVALGLIWSFGGVAFGQEASEPAMQPAELLLVKMVGDLKDATDARVNPVQNCGRPLAARTQNVTPSPTPQLKFYSCALPSSQAQAQAASQTSKAPTLYWPEGRTAIAFYSDNDNKLLGLSSIILDRDGNDRGFTHGLGAQVSHLIRDDQLLVVDLTSRLYTKTAEDDISLVSFNDSGVATSMKPHPSIRGELYQQQILDVTRLHATLEKNKKGFYYRTGLGAEVRQTDPSKFTPALRTQTWWHRVLGEDVVQYQSLPATGLPSSVKTSSTSQEVKLPPGVYNGYVFPGQPNPHQLPVVQGVVLVGQPNPDRLPVFDPEKNTVTRTFDSQEIVSGIKANEAVKGVAPVSVLGSLDVGTRTEVFQGQCELQFEAGGFVATEGRKIIGPNSYVHVSADAKGSVLESRKKKVPSRVNAQYGVQVLYFPNANGQKQIGLTQRVLLESFHRINKKGSTLSPFMVLYMPTGRNAFHKMNDSDSIMRFGVRLNF